MRRAAAIMGAVAMVLATASVFAQAKPSFAGKWTLVPGEAGGGGGGGRGGGRGGRGGGRGGFGGGGCGQECTITQDEMTIKIDRTLGQRSISASYNLDGSDSPNTTMGRGGEQTVVSKAMWEGSSLVITSPGNNGETTMTLSMADGMMTITTSRPGRGGGAARVTTQQYKKN